MTTVSAPARFRTLSARDFDPTSVGFKRKRPVHRTNTGCRTCKLKKVKCDEAKPTCLRCRRNGRVCLFEAVNDASRAAPTSIISLPPSLDLPSSKWGTPSAQLMAHCIENWTAIFSTVSMQAVLETSQASSLVRNTVLAVAATHLRTVAPQVQAHHTAEHFQQLTAINAYRRCLNTQNPTRTMMKHLLMAGTFLNMAAFVLPSPEAPRDGEDADIRESWVFKDDGPDKLNWMAMQAGIRPLVLSMAPYQEEMVSYLASVLLGADADNKSIRGVQYNTSGVPRHWLDVFGMEESVDVSRDMGSCEYDDIYTLPVLVLAHLRGIEEINPHRHLMFMSKMTLKLRILVANWDERALWLVGYWLGLVSRFKGLWWSEARARRDHKAIREWFRGRDLGQGQAKLPWDKMLSDLDEAPTWGLAPASTEARGL